MIESSREKRYTIEGRRLSRRFGIRQFGRSLFYRLVGIPDGSLGTI